MPKAQNLSEVYNNFVVEPLEEENEFTDFYVDRQTPIEEIRERIEISKNNEKYLFLGFKGCGKSTELNRLSSELDMVDDLDKLHRQPQAEDFFYKNYHLLLQPRCHIIYTFPIALAFNPFFENVRHNFDEDFILPQPPVRNRKGEMIEQNLNYYRRIAEKRMNLELIEEDALEHAILSTGKLSEFILVIRDASVKTLTTLKEEIRKDQRIKKGEVEAVLEKLRNTYDRTLTREDIEKLIEINQKKEARDKTVNDDIVRTLLFSLTVVEYETEGERWCEINPILSPLQGKWERNHQLME